MKVVLSIAGSDSSGGAGIQADLKTFEAFGVFGTSVITVLTAQNTTGVSDINKIDSKFIKSQLKAVFDDFDISAIKIGMLFSNEIIDMIREFIKDLNIPIVFDPVFISKAGSKLLNDDAIENLKTLFPYSTIITPNLYEAKMLFDYDINNNKSINEIMQLPCATVVKNHKHNIDKSLDILYIKNSKKTFESEYLDNDNYHGTGCSYSSAIASNLALGKSLEQSVEIAKKFIYEAIKNAPNLGNGSGPIAHKIGGENVKG